jgi:hypothetical protein
MKANRNLNPRAPYGHCAPLFCAVALLACLVLGPLPARAQNYMPLDIGNQWYYENDLGETQLLTIMGETTVLGAVTRVRRQDTTTDLFENYWTQGASGDLYIHGARNLLDGFEIAYQPPILMLDGPLADGKAWVTEGVLGYDLEGNPYGGDPVDVAYRVYFEGFVAVPAGTYYAYGVAADQGPVALEPALMAGHDLFGRRVSPGDAPLDIDITDWYSDGVGLVKNTIYAAGLHPWELHWWSPAVSTEPSSWGRIKALYR